MGKINVASWGMALGAVGHGLLLGRRFGAFVPWPIFLLLLGPWILAYVISFCRVAPCGPRRFALLLSISIWWYSFDTLVCEVQWMSFRPADSHFSDAIIAHAIAYGGAISFIVLIRAIREARAFAESHPKDA